VRDWSGIRQAIDTNAYWDKVRAGTWLDVMKRKMVVACFLALVVSIFL
jgi:hypothetical protein